MPFFVLILVLQTPAAAMDLVRRVFFSFFEGVGVLFSSFFGSVVSRGRGFLSFFSSPSLVSRGGGGGSGGNDGMGRGKSREVKARKSWWMVRRREGVTVEGVHRQEMEKRSGRGWGRRWPWPWRSAMVVGGNDSIV